MTFEGFAQAALAVVCGLAVGCGSITGTKPDGGSGGAGGSGPGKDAAADSTDARPPGFCNTAADCVPQYLGPCCGFCVAIGDAPLPASVCPTGTVVCLAVPGGCSCVNHQCVSGSLASGA